LAAQPVGRFTFTFTPKHGSWLNLIEGFFSKLARSVLRHIRVSSKHELKERLLAFISDLNREPVVQPGTTKSTTQRDPIRTLSWKHRTRLVPSQWERLDGIERLGAAAPERAGREVDRLKALVAAVKPKEASCSRQYSPARAAPSAARSPGAGVTWVDG
jgi:hypothetical protein